MKFAARHSDLVSCPKHAVGLIESPLDRDVLINNRPAAVLGDPCTCVDKPGVASLVQPLFEAPNKIMAGMADILVNGKPLAALGHNTVHDVGGPVAPTGAVVTCTWDVWVGGNTQIGDAEAARLACLELTASRKNRTGIQSYNNCGPETTRLLVNGTKKRTDPTYLDEDEWLDEQVAAGDVQVQLHPHMDAIVEEKTKAEQKRATDAANAVDPFAPTPEQKAAAAQAEKELREAQGRARLEFVRKHKDVRKWSGGSGHQERHRQLEGTPAEADLVNASMAVGIDGVAHGQGVIMPVRDTPVKAGVKDHQGQPANTALGHIIVVTGVIVDENGKPVTVIYNDTFNACGTTMPAGDFAQKIQTDANANVTRRPVW